MKSRIITIPSGRRLTLGQYCDMWRRLKTMSPNQEVSGWEWYPMTVSSILHAISFGVQDRINRRG